MSMTCSDVRVTLMEVAASVQHCLSSQLERMTSRNGWRLTPSAITSNYRKVTSDT